MSYYLLLPLLLHFMSCQLGDLAGGAGECVVLCGGGVDGGDELLLLLGEKVLPVCRLVLLFPFLVRPGMDLWAFLSVLVAGRP
jgi:hypothetical protein